MIHQFIGPVIFGTRLALGVALGADDVLLLLAPSMSSQAGAIMLTAGIGWDRDLPLRPWPAVHRDGGGLQAAWCGLFVGLHMRAWGAA